MYLNGIDQKTTFILGAGATRGSLNHVVVNRKRLRPPLNGDFFDVAKTFARASGRGSMAEKRLVRLKRFFKDELPVKGTPSMEEAFNLLYIAKDFPEIYNVRPGRKSLPGERQEIEDFLLLVFQMLSKVGSATGENGYKRLVTRLGPYDTIITLNYDTLLDSALFDEGWNPMVGYCIAGGTKKIKWKPKNLVPASKVSNIHLLKLHGSLNWFVRGSFVNLSSVFDKKPVNISVPREREIAGHVRQIIPPIYGKFFRHDHWRRLWRLAHEALQKADLLVVVGCSLVDTDFHLRALISRVVQYRRKNSRLFNEVFVVDHNLHIRRKWARVLRGAAKKFKHINRFEKFLHEEVRV